MLKKLKQYKELMQWPKLRKHNMNAQLNKALHNLKSIEEDCRKVGLNGIADRVEIEGMNILLTEINKPKEPSIKIKCNSCNEQDAIGINFNEQQITFYCDTCASHPFITEGLSKSFDELPEFMGIVNKSIGQLKTKLKKISSIMD